MSQLRCLDNRTRPGASVAVAVLIFLGAAAPAQANDGSFYASGDTIHPFKETRVALRKEVLTVARRGKWIHVDVQFEFENPDAEQRKVTTGFVTPFPAGDVALNDQGIRDFTVLMNDRPLAYQLKKHVKGNLAETWEFPEGNYAYLFEAVFQPGRNLVHHTYDIRASSTVEIPYELFYTLTSARSWANGRIDDFTLRIAGDGIDVIALNREQFPGGNFKIVGTGREHRPGARMIEKRFRVFAIKDGVLEIRATNFVPKKNLYVSWMPPILADGGLSARDALYKDLGAMKARLDEDKASSRDLDLLRNAVYAKYGRVFRKPALAAWFAKQFWYFPDPLATDAGIEAKFTRAEQNLLSEIAKLEKLLSGTGGH